MYSVSEYLVRHPVGSSSEKEMTTEYRQVGFPIRKSSDQSLFAAPRSLSQRITSFIASDRQGIHQTPFLRLIRSRTKQAHYNPHAGIFACFSTFFLASIARPTTQALKRESTPGRNVGCARPVILVSHQDKDMSWCS